MDVPAEAAPLAGAGILTHCDQGAGSSEDPLGDEDLPRRAASSQRREARLVTLPIAA